MAEINLDGEEAAFLNDCKGWTGFPPQRSSATTVNTCPDRMTDRAVLSLLALLERGKCVAGLLSI